MRSTTKLFGLGLTAATLAFAGCAPVVSTLGYGPGLQLGITPTGSLNLFSSQCSLMSVPGVASPFMGTSSAASQVMARKQQVNQIQYKFMSFSAGARPNVDAWKSIAGGGC